MLQNGLLALQIALVACCLYLVYSVGAALFGSDPVPEPRIPPATASVASERSLEDYALIAARNLFQTLAVAPVEIEEPEEEIEESSLRFTLLGTAATIPRDHSVAVLEDEVRRRLQLHVGDELSVGVTLERIERERVIVSNHGRLEAISLSDDDQPRPAPPTTRSPTPARRPPVRPNRQTLSDRLRRVAKTAEQTPAATVRPRGILDQARMLPTYDPEGNFEGLKVNFVQGGSAVEEMGFQVGDLITSVNGAALETPAEGLRALRAVQAGEQLVVQVDRAGQPVTLEYVLEE